MSKRFAVNICVFAVTLYLARRWKETRISPYFTGYDLSTTVGAIDDSQNLLLWDLLFTEKLFVDQSFLSGDYSIRPDVIRHYYKHGGIEGFKEREHTLKARISHFKSGKHKLSELPKDVRNLVVEKVKDRCLQSDLDLEASSFHFQVLLPGQTTGLYVDSAHAIGENDDRVDGWLMAVAASSGLYRNHLKNSAKAIVFLNKWNSTTFGGSLVYYDKNEVQSKSAGNERNSLIVLTGTHTVHGIAAFRSAQVPRFLIGQSDLSMAFDRKEQVWVIRNKNDLVRTFRRESLHVTLNVEGICETSDDSPSFPPKSTILQTLKTDLIESKGYSEDAINALTGDSLNDALINEYLAYPPPGRALLPFNYCSWIDDSPKLYAFLKPLCG